MPRTLKTALIAVSLLAGATVANADQLLKDLAAKGSIITLHGTHDGH